MAGENDGIARPKMARKMYQAAEEISAVYAELKGANHYELTFGARRWSPYVVSMFNCHLKGWKKACNKVHAFYADICSLCNCKDKMPMNECNLKNRYQTRLPEQF